MSFLLTVFMVATKSVPSDRCFYAKFSESRAYNEGTQKRYLSKCIIPVLSFVNTEFRTFLSKKCRMRAPWAQLSNFRPIIVLKLCALFRNAFMFSNMSDLNVAHDPGSFFAVRMPRILQYALQCSEPHNIKPVSLL